MLHTLFTPLLYYTCINLKIKRTMTTTITLRLLKCKNVYVYTRNYHIIGIYLLCCSTSQEMRIK